MGSGGASPIGTGGKSPTGGSGGLTSAGGTGGSGTGGNATGGTSTTGGTGTGGAATGGVSSGSGGAQNISCPAQGTGGLASLATGLIGYWKFEDGAAAATTPDDSGMNHPGTYSTAKPAITTSVPPQLAGKSTNALVFNGSSSWVSLPAGSFGTWSAATSYTIAAWVSVTAFDGDWQGIIANEATGNYCGLYIAGANNGTLNAFRYEGNDSGFGDFVPTPGVWYHVALVQDVTGNQQRLFVNGQSVGTGGLKDCTTAGVFSFGSSDGTANGAFNGSLDDVRFYSRALTGPELAALACGAQ